VTGENIICFAKDWAEDPTSNNHVMTELARRNRVLWVNSLATRVPNLTSGRDLGKILRKLRGLFRGAMRASDNLWVYTPLVLPLPHSRIAAALNRWILRITLGLQRRKLGMPEFQLWTFLPTTADYIGKLGESVSVYYCVDEWSKFNYVNGAKVAMAERRLCSRSDIVFATAQSLVDSKITWNSETHLARHGVDHELFARAVVEHIPVPAELLGLPKPVVGFYGTLQDWVDLDLITHIARRHGEWSIVLIGKVMVDLSILQKYSNIHVIGRKPHADLPKYCRSFDVGIIPYVVDQRILHVNPIKLREFLSAGVPVVSVDLPEVRPYSRYCHIASDPEDFVRGIEQTLRTDCSDLRKQRSEAMREETWERKVARVAEQVMRVKRAKALRKGNPA
jgi:glycosyltransferase involved in cell wall biosynthesis